VLTTQERQGLRAAAGPRHSAPAIAASLGCVEASLKELGSAVADMRATALGTVRRHRSRSALALRSSRETSRWPAPAAPPRESTYS
jgi:hypothetical protein